MIDRRPALIVQCLGAADVMAAVDFARDSGLRLSVRGGGHSVAGNAVCEDGLMIDLSRRRGVRVDPRAARARVEPGACLGDLDAEVQAFGLAAPAGVDSRTGVAGLTLGGGQGFLSRSFGLTIDSLLSADVVTAEGQLIRASSDEHPDLFWALRGGGGDFGIVTSFEFRLHPVGPEVMTAQIFHPAEAAGRVLRFYRDFMATAPDAVAVYALCVPVPPVPSFPTSHHGRTAIALVGVIPAASRKAARSSRRLLNSAIRYFARWRPCPTGCCRAASTTARPTANGSIGSRTTSTSLRTLRST